MTDRALARARALARVLDTAVRVPGTRIRFGLDPLLGLIPGGGDAVGAVLSAYIVVTAARLGAPAPVLGRMLLNVVIDAAVGTIPLVGDLFDVAYKANVRNVGLLERYARRPGEVTRASRWMAYAAVVAVLGLIAAVGVAVVLLGRALWQLLAG